MSDVRLCKDCKHIDGWPGSFARCTHDDNMTTSLITGNPVPINSIEFCREKEGHCGLDGLHFKQQEPA